MNQISINTCLHLRDECYSGSASGGARSSSPDCCKASRLALRSLLAAFATAFSTGLLLQLAAVGNVASIWAVVAGQVLLQLAAAATLLAITFTVCRCTAALHMYTAPYAHASHGWSGPSPDKVLQQLQRMRRLTFNPPGPCALAVVGATVCSFSPAFLVLPRLLELS